MMGREHGIDVLIESLYASISGPAGKPRDWNRQAELFLPGARISIVHLEADGAHSLENLSVCEYSASRSPYFEGNSFYEVEVSREVATHGDLMHVFSEFEGRESPAGPLIAHGFNSLQLVYSSNRWWILSLAWEATGLAGSLRSPDSVRL